MGMVSISKFATLVLHNQGLLLVLFISKASFDLKYLEKGLFAFKRPQRQLRQYRQDFGKKNIDLDQL